MIIGIGTDIVEVERIKSSLTRTSERFAQRILSDNEYEQFKKNNFPERFLAKKFAAKEAFAKALGTGFRNGLNMCDIEITHTELGQPIITYIGESESIKELLSTNSSCHITISDEKNYAVAFVIIEQQ